MAKILCKNCKKMVEDTWTICPGCGKPIAARKPKQNTNTQPKPKIEKPQTTIKKEEKIEPSVTPKPKKRIAKTASAPSGGDMSNLTKSINTAKTKNRHLDFATSSPAVAAATGVARSETSKESFLEDNDTAVEDVSEEPAKQEAVFQKPTVSSEQKQYPATRGLRRPNKNVDEETATNDVVKKENNRPKNSTPLGLPQMELFNIPGAPYPVTYMEQPAGANGAIIKIPYLVTDKGLQPWINTPPVVDGETRPIPETTRNDEESVSDGPDIDMPDALDEPDFDFDPEAEADIPGREDNSPAKDDVPMFDEPDFDEPNFESSEAEPISAEQPKETDSSLFMAPEDEMPSAAHEDEKPAVKTELRKKKTKEEQLDEEDEEAFEKALRVTNKTAEKEEKKKKLKDMLGGKRTEEKIDTSEESSDEEEEESETSFDGFNPNEDHYYDDTPPSYPSDKDHITVDFILRVFGAFALIIFVVIALIYMV